MLNILISIETNNNNNNTYIHTYIHKYIHAYIYIRVHTYSKNILVHIYGGKSE